MVMKMRGFHCRGVLAAAALGLSSISSAQPPADTRAEVAKSPTVIDGPQEFPADAKLAGHNGTVLVSAVITEAGLVEDASVKQSSGSVILDQAAVDAVKNWKLTPALDESGKAVRTVIKLNVEYTQAFSEKYSCRQFVIDSDWFDSERGLSRREELRIYKTLRGMFVASALRRGGAASLSKFDFDKNWNDLIESCRKNPKTNFSDIWRKSL